MKRKLDMDRIAEGLGAERRGKVSATGGYFGAMQLLADVEARFRVPAGGGRPTDPRWTERRLVPLAPRTLERLTRPSSAAGESLNPAADVSISSAVAARLLRAHCHRHCHRGEP